MGAVGETYDAVSDTGSGIAGSGRFNAVQSANGYCPGILRIRSAIAAGIRSGHNRVIAHEGTQGTAGIAVAAQEDRTHAGTIQGIVILGQGHISQVSGIDSIPDSNGLR